MVHKVIQSKPQTTTNRSVINTTPTQHIHAQPNINTQSTPNFTFNEEDTLSDLNASLIITNLEENFLIEGEGSSQSPIDFEVSTPNEEIREKESGIPTPLLVKQPRPKKSPPLL